jgi:hypothetical protein
MVVKPVTFNVEDNVAAFVTFNVEESVVAPETFVVPDTSNVAFALPLAFPIPSLPSTAVMKVCVVLSPPTSSKLP